jgi:hypothetical protein
VACSKKQQNHSYPAFKHSDSTQTIFQELLGNYRWIAAPYRLLCGLIMTKTVEQHGDATMPQIRPKRIPDPGRDLRQSVCTQSKAA